MLSLQVSRKIFHQDYRFNLYPSSSLLRFSSLIFSSLFPFHSDMFLYAKEKGTNSYLYRGSILLHLALIREIDEFKGNQLLSVFISYSISLTPLIAILPLLLVGIRSSEWLSIEIDGQETTSLYILLQNGIREERVGERTIQNDRNSISQTRSLFQESKGIDYDGMVQQQQ